VREVVEEVGGVKEVVGEMVPERVVVDPEVEPAEWTVVLESAEKGEALGVEGRVPEESGWVVEGEMDMGIGEEGERGVGGGEQRGTVIMVEGSAYGVYVYGDYANVRVNANVNEKVEEGTQFLVREREDKNQNPGILMEDRGNRPNSSIRWRDKFQLWFHMWWNLVL